MVVETKSISRKRCLFLCSWVLVLLFSCSLFGAEQSHIKMVGVGVIPARYRVFSLRHISAERGSKLLSEAGIGTVSQLPNTNTLLVTAQPAELIKATAILKLVDSNEPFVMKAIFPASEAGNLPSNEQIAAELGDISIGTFSEPPRGDAKVKAIIDIHRDVVVAIAPAAEIERIISAANSLLVGSESYLAPGTNSEQRNANGELFGKLLDSLAEAKQRAAGQAQQPSEPNAVAAVAEVLTEPEPCAVSEQAEETFVPELKRPQKSGLPAVAEGPEAKIAVEKLKSEPEPEPAAAVRSYEPEPIADGNEMLELDLPEKLEIGDLLRLVGEYLHLDYMYDPDKIKGAVTLKLRGPIKVKDLYPLLESVLKFRGFVMTRKGNLVTIVPKAEALEIDPDLYTEVERAELGDVIITRIFNLKHIDTASAQNLLTGMKLGADIRPIPATRTLIVTGYAYRMARIEEVLEMTDKPGEPKHFRFRQLKYTMAKTLAPKIKTLAEQLGTVSITVATPAAPAAARVTRKPGESSAAFRRRQEAARKAAAARAAPAAPTARPTVYLEADERTNRILMIGLQEQLAVVDELIDTLDVEQQDLRALRLYEIQHVGAEEVAEKLQELGIIGGGRTTTSRAPAAKSAKPATPTTTTTKERLAGEPQVVIISSTNSLLVNATAEQHIRIAQIIGYVDCEPEQAAINYIVYPLENQDPEDLAGILNKLILETVEKQDKEGKITRTTRKKTEEDITIIPDPKTYSLIVYANKRNQQWISSLIKTLDEYRAQVLLDVTLVEITKNDEFMLDLDLVSKFPKLTRIPGQATDSNGVPFGDIVPIGTMNFLTALVDPFPLKRVTEAVVTAGTGKGFYADEHIQALLVAMDKKGYGRILARPKLLVNDNEAGTIKAEEKTYVVRKESQIVPVSAGVSNTVTKDIFEDYTAGITLEIEPHISKGDNLRLIISLTRSDFRITQEVLDTGKPPDTVTSDVETVVTVPDGTTIILGGLERLKQSKGGTKVPLLGDIPLVGGLFRSTANTDTQSRLYVFVKAHILRPGEELTGESDIEVVSRKNRDRFEKYEEKFQQLESWPGVKPEPMEPLKILEAD